MLLFGWRVLAASRVARILGLHDLRLDAALRSRRAGAAAGLLALFGNVSDVTQRYEQRYIPASNTPRRAVPSNARIWWIENNDPGQPVP